MLFGYDYRDMLDAVKREARMANLYDRQQAEAKGGKKMQIEIALRMVNEFSMSPDKAAEMTGLQVSDFMASAGGKEATCSVIVKKTENDNENLDTGNDENMGHDW